MTSNLIGLLCGGFFVLVFFIGGVVAIIFGFRNRKKGTESQNWPKVTGTITQTTIKKDTSTDEDGFTTTSFTPEVEYQYQIGSAAYSNKRVSFGGTRSFNSHKKAEASISQYPTNASVLVYYDPQNPEESRTSSGKQRNNGFDHHWGCICGSLYLRELFRYLFDVFQPINPAL